ncbi:substrate-binding domain-containing protein, partial [Coprobacillus cateniformis]|nr:substrate-binding domain-containing protein [Coprobacillus cateniformis]
PLVVLDNEYDDMLYDYVAINNSDGSYAITKLLIDNGHKNIGLINSSYQINNFKKRKMGYRNALDDYNLPFRPENEILVDPSPEGSYRDTATYLKAFLNELSLDELPTAFYAVNDNIAIGAVRAFQELNIDISICGFDDLPISKLFNPPLTTVQVDKKQLGKIAVSRLINKINGDLSHLKILVATKIVERDSVKKT